MVKQLQQAFSATFRPRSGAAPFFTSVIVWGIGIGCFAASVNNFLVDIHDLNQFQRGLLEFFREMPGLLLVFLLALLHRTSDWQILRIGTLISMVGAIALCVPANLAVVTLLVMVWSTGEHLAMPVRSAIAMQIAHDNRSGASLGYVSAAMHAGPAGGRHFHGGPARVRADRPRPSLQCCLGGYFSADGRQPGVHPFPAGAAHPVPPSPSAAAAQVHHFLCA